MSSAVLALLLLTCTVACYSQEAPQQQQAGGDQHHSPAPNPSAIISDRDWTPLSRQPAVSCTWKVTYHDRAQTETATFPIGYIVDTLTSLQTSTSPSPAAEDEGSAFLRVLENEHAADYHVIELTQGGLMVSIITGLSYHSAGDMVCMEMLLAERRLDVVLPFHESEELYMINKHPVEYLERLYRASFLIPPPAAVSTFSDKSDFAQYLHDHGLGMYLPTIFHAVEEVTFPAVAKVDEGTGGRGVYIVQNRAELDVALKHIGDQSHLLEEAVPGDSEFVSFFMARNGVLLATCCVRTINPTPLTVVASHAHTDIGYPVRCLDIEALAPVINIVRRVVESSSYNGFGVLNYKLVPRKLSSEGLAQRLGAILDIAEDADDVVLTDFWKAQPIDLAQDQYESVPRFFELNPRIGGRLYTQWPYAKLAMIEAYMAHGAVDAK